LKVIDLTRESSESSLLSWSDANHHTLVTRIEAPGWLVKNGKMLSDYDLNVFISNAVLLDLSHKKPGDSIDDEDLEAAEEAAGLAVREGEIVILRTGWDGTLGSDDYSSGFPAMSDNGAEYLGFKKVVGVGVDAPSVDRSGRKDLGVHVALFESGIFVIENLCGLDRIAEDRFRLITLPLKMKAAVSLVRVVAALNSTV